MAYQQTQRVSWRSRLGIWLQAVQVDAQLFGGNFQAAVSRHRQEFPPSRFYSGVRKLATDEIAKWFLKQAIGDVSQAAGLSLTPDAIDTIAELAVSLL